MTASSVTEQIRARCTQLQLPTIAAQAEPCFHEAGHGEALPTLLEVLDRESDDRHQRRVERLRRAAKLLTRWPAPRSTSQSTLPT